MPDNSQHPIQKPSSDFSLEEGFLMDLFSVFTGGFIEVVFQKPKFLPNPPLQYYPGIELFSQAATHQVSSPCQRFTSEFGMDRCGSIEP